MLWDIRAAMKPALSIIDLIPNVHRSPALSLLRRAVADGRPLSQRLSPEDRDLAFHEAQVPLTSPIGARVLLALYRGGHLKLKKPPVKSLPALEAYIATEPAFRAKVAAVLAEDTARQQRLAEIIANPDCATVQEVTPQLIDKVMTARLGHGVLGTLRIAGLACHRSSSAPATNTPEADRLRNEPQILCWWLDTEGQRQGDRDEPAPI